MGERIATSIISEILNDEDILLTNVGIFTDGKETELDNVIINTKGIFIIEVKNYSGQLIGDEEDAEWIKNKVTEAGYLYQKTVRNPIRQVKRQEYLMSKLLKDNGIHVWIKGYVFLLERNSPVKSAYILDTQKDIDVAVHPDAVDQMDVEMVESVKRLLMKK
ncbi:MAG: NERD domain-containing protein [Lachnospiraceae bacterium]|nr:NERD domain-containing protein [Lachnospiraceae bacterium]